MKEEFFDAGTEIIGAGEDCTNIYFVVQGRLELTVLNSMGEKFVLHVLRQGDVIGQYSILFNESFLFNTVAQTSVRLLKIDQDFFLENQETIEGLKDSILEAEKYVEQYGIPICDFTVFDKKKLSPMEKFRRGVNHVITLNKLN